MGPYIKIFQEIFYIVMMAICGDYMMKRRDR